MSATTEVVPMEDVQANNDEYVRCAKCKQDKPKICFRHTLLGKRFKQCKHCTTQATQRNEHKHIDKSKLKDKQKEYYKSIKGKDAREKWKNQLRTCPICKLDFQNHRIYNHYKTCKHTFMDVCN